MDKEIIVNQKEQTITFKGYDIEEVANIFKEDLKEKKDNTKKTKHIPLNPFEPFKPSYHDLFAITCMDKLKVDDLSYHDIFTATTLNRG